MYTLTREKLKTLTSFAINGGFYPQQYQETFDIGARKMPRSTLLRVWPTSGAFGGKELSRQKLSEEFVLTIVFTLGSSQRYIRHTQLRKFMLYRAFK